ncbi:MAG: radical SAM protein [Bacteroidota bacterium]
MEKQNKTEKHPCFNVHAKNKYARVHLPIAPKCNIQCGYCNRKYDCVNESRPGVTSTVLNPQQALEYFKIMSKKIENISTVGIAGPGDPFAMPDETIETFRLIKQEFPEILFCVSTNGANLYNYIDEIADLGVSHVTLTINSLEPEVLKDIYSWVRINKKMYRGLDAGKMLLAEQLRCIPKLKKRGIFVKINTIMIPGVNDVGIESLAQHMKKLGADIMNCVPLCPVEDTKFANVHEPTKEEMIRSFDLIEKHILPMKHCARCRADAAGLLGKDTKSCHKILKETAMKSVRETHTRPRIAVASYEGILVNQHLGEAQELFIYEKKGEEFVLVEKRTTPESGKGNLRWIELAESLYDCRAILVGGAGSAPTKILEGTGMQVVQMAGLITAGLEGIDKSLDMSKLSKTEFKCGSGCGGNAQGCA